MRRAGPFIIVIVGVLALLVDFLPGLKVPVIGGVAGASPTRVLEWKLGLDLQGGFRVEYQAQPNGDVAPTAGDMSTIRDIIERRVNSTGVSGAGGPDAGRRPHRRRAARCPGQRRDRGPGRQDGSTRLRAPRCREIRHLHHHVERADRGGGRPAPAIPPGHPVQRRSDQLGQPGHRFHDRQAAGELHPQGSGQGPVRDLVIGEREPLLRDRPGRQCRVGAVHPERRSWAGRARSRAASRPRR